MTRRQDIIQLLATQRYSAQQLTSHFAAEMGEVVEDLQHIGRSIYPNLKRTHPECKHCGFVFKERSKLKTPSKCPECKGQSIVPSLFYIENAD